MNGALPPTVIMTMMRATAPQLPLTPLDLEYRRARKRLNALPQFLHETGHQMPYPWVTRWAQRTLMMGIVTNRHQHKTLEEAQFHCNQLRCLGVDAVVRPN